MEPDTSSRQIVGLMDLGEQSPYNTHIHAQTNLPYLFQCRELGVYQHCQQPQQPEPDHQRQCT